MKQFPLYGDNAKLDSPIRKVLESALGLPLSLSSIPTTSGNELPNHGDLGYFGTNLYINLGGSTYRISMTLV